LINSGISEKTIDNAIFNNRTSSFNLDQNINCPTSEQVERYIYTDNVAYNLDGAGQGLIDGVVEDIIALNPLSLINSLTEPAVPPCAKVSLYTIDTNNNHSISENFVALNDIANIPNYNFQNNINPVSSESFSNIKPNKYKKKLPKDPFILLYFLLILIIGMYILYKINYK
jgi:hypothetical protein